MSTELPALERFRANKKMAIVLLNTLETLPGLLNLFRCLILGANRQVKGQQVYPRWALRGWEPGKQLDAGSRVRLAGLGTLHRPPRRLSPGLLPVSRSPVSWLAWQHCPLLEKRSHRAPPGTNGQGQGLGIWWGRERLNSSVSRVSSYVAGISSIPSLMSALTQVCRISRQLCQAFALWPQVCLTFLRFRTRRKSPTLWGYTEYEMNSIFSARLTTHTSLPQITSLIAPFFLLWKINNMVSLSKTQGYARQSSCPRNPSSPLCIRLLVFSCGSSCPFVKGHVTWFPFAFFLWENRQLSCIQLRKQCCRVRKNQRWRGQEAQKDHPGPQLLRIFWASPSIQSLPLEKRDLLCRIHQSVWKCSSRHYLGFNGYQLSTVWKISKRKEMPNCSIYRHIAI